MDSRILLDAMAAAFVETAAATPRWPDPHPGDVFPREEEYSRCLDPGKYRIIAARANAWFRAFTELGLAAVEDAGDPASAWRDGQPELLERAVWVRPVRSGAVPMLLGFRAFDGVVDAVVLLGVAEPAVLLASLPDCGCDACDGGSDELLAELDRYLLAAADGSLVHVTTRKGVVISTPSWRSASGRFGTSVDVDALVADARDGRSRHQVVSGASWW